MNSDFHAVTTNEGIYLFSSDSVMHSCGTHDSEMGEVGASTVTLDII